jgi:hypothetical protein
MGARIREIGRAAADLAADDIEANLEIEARVAARREAHGADRGPGPATKARTETTAKEKPKPPRRAR